MASFECRAKAVRTRPEGDAVTTAIMPDVAFPPWLHTRPSVRTVLPGRTAGSGLQYDAGVEAIRTTHQGPDEDEMADRIDSGRGATAQWQTAVALALLVWIGLIAVWAYRPWSDHVPLEIPPEIPREEVEAESARFECGAPFGDATVEPSEEATESPYPVSRQPCTGRVGRQSLAIADIAAGVLGLVVLVRLGRRSRAPGGFHAS